MIHFYNTFFSWQIKTCTKYFLSQQMFWTNIHPFLSLFLYLWEREGREESGNRHWEVRRSEGGNACVVDWWWGSGRPVIRVGRGVRLSALRHVTYLSLTCMPHGLWSHTSVTGKSCDIQRWILLRREEVEAQGPAVARWSSVKEIRRYQGNKWIKRWMPAGLVCEDRW